MWYFQQMLKTAHSLKAAQSGEALRTLLLNVPAVQVTSIKAEAQAVPGDWQPDFIARLLVNGQQHQLICEYLANAQPRYARHALLELRNFVAQQAPQATPILLAPFLSPEVRQMCQENGAGYLDMEGNARIAFDHVFIERLVANKPVAAQRELKSLFRPKSAQVLRVMLREPARAWRVTELSEISGVSLGHVSNVRTGLMDREWARISDYGLVLSAPDALLDAWRDSYTAPPGERLRFYTPLHGSTLIDAVRKALAFLPSTRNSLAHAACASFSAAQWLAPYARTGTDYFYADKEGLGQLQTALRLAPVSKGENVVVIMPKDLGLLADTVEPAPGAVCTSPLQTWLDLSIAGERGAEAADHLRRTKLTWPQ